MQNFIEVKNDLLIFPELEKLGVKNFATFNNEKWGSMSIAKQDDNRKYKELLPQKHEMIYLFADQNNNVQVLDEDNLVNYGFFNKHKFSDDELKILGINSDSIITKEKLPIFISPADCSVIIFTGIDERDNKRFIGFTHAGIWGTMINIHTKTLDLILHNYKVKPENIDVFIFPSVSYKYYKKSKTNDVRAKILNEEGWKDFVFPDDKEFGIDIEGKIVHDLKKLGIKNVSTTGLDAYEEHEKGNLFSFSYTKKHNLETSNFGVCAYIE